MSLPTSGVSLSDLTSAGVVLSHAEAVAIAREATLRAVRGELSHIPAPDDLRLGADGSIAAASHLPAAGSDIRRAARLLTAVLAHATPDEGAPAMFRLILARAFAEDEAAYESVEEFMAALAPFSAPDAAAAARHAVAEWEKGHARLESSQLGTAPVPVPAEPDWEPELVREAPPPHEAAPRLVSHAATVPRSRRPASGARVTAVLAASVLLLALVATAWFVRTRDAEEDPQSQVNATPAPEQPQKQAASPVAGPEPPAVPSPQPTIATSGTPAKQSPPPGPRSPAPPRERRTGTVPAPVSAKTQPEPAARQVLASAAFSPAFASASTGMFYHSGRGPDSDVMRAGTDGSGTVLKVTRIVDDRGSNFHPRPSPDGRSIAFDSDRDGERGVYVAGTDGRGVRRISGPGFAAVPSWSPDGRQLAFVRAEENNPRVWNVWMVDLMNGDTRRVTAHRVGQPWGAAWFPDGKRIAYSHEDRLIVRALDGSASRTYASPVAGRQVRTPAVSPDGKRIIFQVRRSGAWMLDVESGAMHRVLEDASAEEFTWSPDGRRVAYHSRQSGTWGVWMMAARNSD